jgi:hypothetical protein
VAQVGDVDEGGGGLDAALKLDHYVSAARYDARLCAVLVEQMQGLFKRRWLKVVLPHEGFAYLDDRRWTTAFSPQRHKGHKGSQRI